MYTFVEALNHIPILILLILHSSNATISNYLGYFFVGICLPVACRGLNPFVSWWKTLYLCCGVNIISGISWIILLSDFDGYYRITMLGNIFIDFVLGYVSEMN